MTNTYLTQNPLGSKAPKDLYDNASNFDEAMNSPSPSFYDRFLKRRETWAGMEKAFEDFLIASGFLFIGEYAADLTFTQRNQYTIRDGIAYRPSTAATLPFTTTGVWATDSANFVAFDSDAALRQDLESSDNTLGVSLVTGAARFVNSVADMLALPNTVTQPTFTLGYYQPGDGGGTGPFYWDADSVETSNGGTIFGTGTGRRKLGDTQSLNVKWFGAKGDNSFDDSVPIQACVDVLIAAGGGNVIVPEGTYNFQSKRPAGLTPWAFEDPNIFVKDATNLNFIGIGNAVFTNSVYPNNRAEQILFYRTTNCSCTGIKFLGNNTGLPTEVNNCGIGMLSNKGLHIFRNHFTGFQGSYIASSWLFDSLIENNRFDVLAGTAIDCAFWQDVVVQKNNFNGNGLGSNLLGTTGFQCAYDTPNVGNNETGVFFRAWTNHVTLRDNKMIGFFTGALMADMVDATIEDNDFHFNYIAGDHPCNGLVVTNTITTFAMRGINIGGNSFTNNGSSVSGGGIALGVGTATSAEITLNNNRIYDNSHYGLSITGGPVKLRGSNNWFGNEQTGDQLNNAVFNGNLVAGSMFINNPGLNPAAPVGKALPAGIGLANAVTNDRSYPVTIYQTGGTGVHVITEAGDDIELAVGTTIRLGPFAKVYFTGVNTSAWTWVYD